MIICGCPRDHLCQQCFNQSLFWLLGGAACRGDRWALNVAKLVRPDKPWPEYEGKVVTIANRYVYDMTSDERVREVFAEACWESAQKQWTNMHAEMMCPARPPLDQYYRTKRAHVQTETQQPIVAVRSSR